MRLASFVPSLALLARSQGEVVSGYLASLEELRAAQSALESKQRDLAEMSRAASLKRQELETEARKNTTLVRDIRQNRATYKQTLEELSESAEQLQALIGANWLKPDAPAGTVCVVTFRIQRSGQVTDVKIETPSGLAFYDRAASRSIYSANPLPPLPPEFRRDELGVHIRFQ